MRRLIQMLGVCAGLAVAAAAQAAVTATDLQVAARALSFMERPLRGAVRVGVVYSASSPQSSRQAEEIRRLLREGLRAGGVTFEPVLIELNAVGGTAVDLLWLTEHVGRDAAVRSLGVGNRAPCVTTDLEQVRSGACLMGVSSAPKVEILVNRDVAKASGVAFATVFRVMITEI